MSTLQTINVKHPSSASNNIVLDSSGNATIAGSMVAGSSYAWRNRIINGDMRIDQRNAGAATANTINGYTVDRWIVGQTVTGKLIAQRNAGSVTPPSGYTNYLGVTSQSAYSVLSSDIYRIYQLVEGFSVADLAWGTASAQTVTLSFWVRSSLTGTFGGAIGTSAGSRTYVFTYTISAANTWEQKTITIPGDTSGTYPTDNTASIAVQWGLGVGSTFSGTAGSWTGSALVSATGAVSVVATNGATFYLTGVQLEVGTVATPFERRDYGRELILCQRYCQKSYPTTTAPGTTSIGGYAANGGLANGTFNARSSIRFAVEMRSAPTLSYWDYVGNASRASSWNTGNTRTDNVSSASFALTDIGTSGFLFNDAGGAGNAGAGACSSGVHWLATSEL